jgi:hypothetical protein
MDSSAGQSTKANFRGKSWSPGLVHTHMLAYNVLYAGGDVAFNKCIRISQIPCLLDMLLASTVFQRGNIKHHPSTNAHESTTISTYEYTYHTIERATVEGKFIERNNCPVSISTLLRVTVFFTQT